MKILNQLIAMSGAGLNVLVFIFCLIPLFSCNAADSSAAKVRVGGACDYNTYKGEAEIVSVIKRTDAPQLFEIKFAFHPQENIREEFARPEGKTWTLVQKDFSYPKKNFLIRYGIKTGKRFPCCLKAIARGTCTPVLFEFPSIPEGWAQ